MPGPISSALEQEVLREVRRRGIVVWLDKDGAYTPFVDDLIRRHHEGELPCPVVAFRGSFLEVVLALEPFGGTLDNTALLLHMPGFNEETIRKTPVLDLYEPGHRFRKSLETLVREAARGLVAPDEIERFVSAPGLCLQAADEWLAAQTSAARAGLEGLLAQMSLLVIAEELLAQPTFLTSRLHTEADLDILAAYLHRQTGMDEAWIGFYGSDPAAARLENLAAALGAWLLCVEYVHDLARLPYLEQLRPLKALSPQLVDACTEVVRQLRARHPDRYAALADEIELHLHEELSATRAEDLGRIDTFRVEEARVLAAAMDALKQGAWDAARGFAEARKGESFWLQRDQARRFAWTLVEAAASLGQALAREPRPLEGAHSLEDALARYSERAFEVDRAHRRFEQQRLTLLEPRLPHFGDLQEIVDALRRLYRAWADDLARAFTALCREHRFRCDDTLQQRTLYEQVVHPMVAAQDKVAFFLIDAFRYEMAVELAEEMRGTGTQVDLRARLAELPTITSVGMNALAPVAQGGRLMLATASTKDAFNGFKTGEFTVRRPEDRARAMGLRSLGRTARLLTLAEVCEDDAAALKRKLGSDALVVIHSKEIDDAGEANVGLATFELTLRQIKAAWHHLQAAGVKQFVCTADHGFLLQDATTALSRAYGTKRDPSRRHALAEGPLGGPGTVNVPLATLGYLGPGGEPAEGTLVLSEDTAVFATGNPGATFVHGGNSLQERVIPVLTVGRKRAAATGLAAYAVEARAEPDVLGMRRLSLRVVFAKDTGLLPLGTPAPLDLSLRVPGRGDIRITIKDAPKILVKNGRLQVPVGDGWTEVFFALEGAVDEQVRVEIFHPDAVEPVAPFLIETWFAVVGTGTGARPPSVPPSPGPSWQEGFADSGVRKVFAHLEKHGSISEAEVTQFLGSPRAFRRFSLDFEGHARKVPFKVRIETTPGGKRYVKDGVG